MRLIGIVGGGQLGQMMIDAAKQEGFECLVLEESTSCPCKVNAYEIIEGKYDDLNKLEEICKRAECLTYEFENVDANAISILEKKYNIPQSSRVLRISQNRIREKDFASSCGFSCPCYARVTSQEELLKAIKDISYPCILKTSEGGYDGKGQKILYSENDLIDIDREYILESKIDFDYEVSVIASRSINNDMVIYPLFKNEHKHGILYHTAFLFDEIKQKQVEQIMKNFMERLDYRGTLCVELFIKGNEIIFNEMAPRPHNSGHMTIEACSASQYTNHIRGIMGLPLIKPQILHNTEMVNILGSDILQEEEMKKEKHVIIHNYQKKEVRDRRKMGHATFVDASQEEIESFMKKYIKESQDE
ncbi:MAG: 5-(carboxyamino)imidazole ribonucleotide synthase [Bacilli bacterium]